MSTAVLKKQRQPHANPADMTTWTAPAPLEELLDRIPFGGVVLESRSGKMIGVILSPAAFELYCAAAGMLGDCELPLPTETRTFEEIFEK